MGIRYVPHMVYRYLCQISMSQRKLCRHVSVKTRSVGNNLSMKIFLQETFVQEKFGQEKYVQERFVQERFVQETFVQENFVQETFVQERFVQETKWSREPPHQVYRQCQVSWVKVRFILFCQVKFAQFWPEGPKLCKLNLTK